VEAGNPKNVEFRVLGAVEVLRDGQPLPLGGPRQRALLSLLTVQPGRAVGADRLVDELWAGEPPSGAETTLRSYVSRLRTSLGRSAEINATAAGYSIAVDPEAIDSFRFERLIRAAEADLARGAGARAAVRLRAALDLWHGHPFGLLANDGLLRVEAERLGELRIHAIEMRMDADLAAGRAADLVDELEALVHEHPFRERLWRALMLALYRADRQADALNAYQRVRLLLAEQLGLDPGKELDRLQQAILRHEVPAATPPMERHNLPVPLTSFIGRQAELDEVGGLIGRERMVTLSGVGGVGKTRLALETARRIAADFSDGVLFVDFSVLAEPNLVVGHVASALEIREQPGPAPADQLAAAIRDREMLLVFDNCEHVRGACAELAERVLTMCERIRILATSRELLGIPGEAEQPISPLTLPDSDDLESVRASDAVQLFLARARTARPTLPDDDTTLAAIGRICLDLDGLPLGIELAAARARALSTSEIAARLNDRFRFLVSWRRLTAARHRTLREAMDWSYDLLTADEQTLLGRLSVFAGGFTLGSVARVCLGGDKMRALELVQRLVDASLVNVEHGADETRYRLLETVRQYGAERLVASGDTEQVRELHGRYFAAFAVDEWEQVRAGGDQPAWVARLDRDRDNLRASLAWHRATGEHEGALRLAESLWRYWWIRGDLHEGRSWLDSAIEAAPNADHRLRARALVGAAGLAWAHGDYADATAFGELARTAAAELADREMEARCLNTLGLIAHAESDFTRAEINFRSALDLFASTDVEPGQQPQIVAVAMDNLASVAVERAEWDLAAELYQRARTIHEARSDAYGTAMADLHLGVAAVRSGRHSAAAPALAAALTAYRRFGFLQYTAECLEAVAAVANATGHSADAIFLLGASAQLRERTGNPAIVGSLALREQELATARAVLSVDDSEASFKRGRAATEEAAIDQALATLADV
jgi:predicted ATPase/DNA-binding SARP family transcriptional activator